MDQTSIAAKWESLALAPAHNKNAKDDYFLFTLVRNISYAPPFVIGHLRETRRIFFWRADDDFLTTNGVAIGKPYNAGMNVDNQALVWRVTLSTVDGDEIEKSIGILSGTG